MPDAFYLFEATNITPNKEHNRALAEYFTNEAERRGYFEEASKEVFEGGNKFKVKFI